MYGRKTEQFCDSVSTERKVVRTEAEPIVVWLVQKEKQYGQNAEPFYDLFSTIKSCTDKTPNIFVNLSVQKDKSYGQKTEAFCVLIGTKVKQFRTGRRTNL